MPGTAILDYDAGNLTSVLRAVEHLGHTAVVTRDRRVIGAADRIIFPGVGAAGAAMDSLEQLGLDEELHEAHSQGKPILGICVGCQVIFEDSEEDGGTAGLGLVPGHVVRFRFPIQPPGPAPYSSRRAPTLPRSDTENVVPRCKIPHMGWNHVDFSRSGAKSGNGLHEVFQGIEPGSEFYFVHSYYPLPAEPRHVQGTSVYGDVPFAAAVADDNLVAVQFHTEKSGRAGLRILENFLTWKT